MEGKKLKKSIITVLGKDSVGIIAKVCTYLDKQYVNILDINQTITGGFFNMMMIVESEEVVKTFPVMASELEQIGEELGVKIQAQHQEISELMKMDVPAAASDPAVPGGDHQRVERRGRTLNDGQAHQFRGLDKRDQAGDDENGVHHVRRQCQRQTDGARHEHRIKPHV